MNDTAPNADTKPAPGKTSDTVTHARAVVLAALIADLVSGPQTIEAATQEAKQIVATLGKK